MKDTQPLYLLIGLAIALALVLAAFESYWQVRRSQVWGIPSTYDVYEENQLLPPIPEPDYAPPVRSVFTRVAPALKEQTTVEEELSYTAVDGVGATICLGTSSPIEEVLEEVGEDREEEVINCLDYEPIEEILEEEIVETSCLEADELIINIIEHSASPEGGMKALYQHIKRNIVYPPTAFANQIEGKVFVSFTVGADSLLSNFKVLRGLGYGCDEEAIRLLKTGPKWNPKLLREKPVDQTFTFPISFKLEYAQQAESGKVYTIVEEGAEPEGGMRSFYRYIRKNLVYPKQVKRMGIDPKLFVSFVVECNGEITDIKVIRSVHASLDKHLIDLLKNGPHWKPAKHKGRCVRQKMIFPIQVCLK